jgi:hypothetical protein
MRWIHGEIPFVSSRKEPFTREGTSLKHSAKSCQA